MASEISSSVKPLLMAPLMCAANSGPLFKAIKMPMLRSERCFLSNPGLPQDAQHTSVMYSCPGFPNGSDPYLNQLAGCTKLWWAPYLGQCPVHIRVPQYLPSNLDAFLESLWWLSLARHAEWERTAWGFTMLSANGRWREVSGESS